MDEAIHQDSPPRAFSGNGRMPSPEGVRFADDGQFFAELRLLRRIRRFLIERGVGPHWGDGSPGNGDSPFNLGRLNLIRSSPGKPPVSYSDWQLLEEKQDFIQRMFTLELQREFRLQNVHRMLTTVPVALLLAACVSILIATFPPAFIWNTKAVQEWQFGWFLIWTSSLGSLGALGFLAVNALSGPRDATFDMSARGLVSLRIVLGALFGSILSIPFCFPDFINFARTILTYYPGDQNGRPAAWEQAPGIIILTPFLLGFSTSLLMAILNRLVKAMGFLFGIDQAAAVAALDLHAESLGSVQAVRERGQAG